MTRLSYCLSAEYRKGKISTNAPAGILTTQKSHAAIWVRDGAVCISIKIWQSDLKQQFTLSVLVALCIVFSDLYMT